MGSGSDAQREGQSGSGAVPVPANARLCVWCQRQLGNAEGQSLERAPAVCDACAAVLTAGNTQPLVSFIEKVAVPLLVIAGSGRVEMANARARVFLGKAAEAIVGRLGGELIECVNASEPGGCGGTEHCSGCTLRRSVQHTHTTGQPLRGVHTCHEIRTPNGIRAAWFELSTERAGELVLLRVQSLGLERRA